MGGSDGSSTSPTKPGKAKAKSKASARVLLIFGIVLLISLLTIARSPVQKLSQLIDYDIYEYASGVTVRPGIGSAIEHGRHNQTTGGQMQHNGATLNSSITNTNCSDGARKGFDLVLCKNPMAVIPASVFVDSSSPIRPPPALELNSNEATSACLIWMDDSQRLVEWIAYHYYTFSLRTLVIFRDPKSTQDLEPIVRRWRGLVDIKAWHNQSDFYVDPGLLKTIWAKEEKLPGIKNWKKRRKWDYDIHIRNQEEFYRSCSMYLQGIDRTWTIFIDTDEHIVFNSKFIQDVPNRMREPGSIFNTLRHIQTHNATKGRSQFEGACVTIQRTQYGAIESPDEHTRHGVPDFVDPYRFQTLRFRHVEQDTYLGKTIADVSRLTFQGETISTHQLVVSQCPDAWGRDNDIFRINHYIGSFEAFQRPNDRRGRTASRTKKWHDEGTKADKFPGPPVGDEARYWIRGFVDQFGQQDTELLLEGAGSPYNAETAMERKSLACGDNCLEPYAPTDSILEAIDRSLASATAA